MLMLQDNSKSPAPSHPRSPPPFTTTPSRVRDYESTLPLQDQLSSELKCQTTDHIAVKGLKG